VFGVIARDVWVLGKPASGLAMSHAFKVPLPDWTVNWIPED